MVGMDSCWVLRSDQHTPEESRQCIVFHFIDAKFGHFPQNPLLLYLYLYKPNTVNTLHVKIRLSGVQTPHLSASNIAGTSTVAMVPMPAYTATFVSTDKRERRNINTYV
jgi:hypothetical protein